MVDLFKQEDACDKYFKEGIYAPKTVETKEIKKENEEVVHIDDELPKEEKETSTLNEDVELAQMKGEFEE